MFFVVLVGDAAVSAAASRTKQGVLKCTYPDSLQHPLFTNLRNLIIKKKPQKLPPQKIPLVKHISHQYNYHPHLQESLAKK